MKSLKEKALDKILLGVGLKLIPLASFGFLIEIYPELSDSSDSVVSLVLSLFVLISCLIGYIFFIKGCCLYIKITMSDDRTNRTHTFIELDTVYTNDKPSLRSTRTTAFQI